MKVEAATSAETGRTRRSVRVAMVAPYPRSVEAHGEESLGGVASYTRCLVEALARTTDVLVVAPRPEGALRTHSTGRIEVREVSARDVPRAIRELARYASVDAIHLQFEQHLYGGPRENLRIAGALRAARRAKRVVVTIHQVPDLAEVDRAFLRRNGFPPFPRAARAWLRAQYAALARGADVLLVHEPRLQERLVAQYGIAASRIAVVPHGIERVAPTYTQPRAKALLRAEGKVVLLYFGYVTGYKGVDLLVDALERLDDEARGRLRVIIAGKVPERKLENETFRAGIDALEARIAALGRFVERKGFLTAAQIPLHLEAADAVVFPYRQVFGASGPFALAVGHGRPFLASEAFRGMGVPDEAMFPLDADALAARIAQVAREPAALDALATHARRIAESATWTSVADRTAALYAAKPSLLVMGAYGQDNLGDEALLEVHLQQLSGARITVASSSPAQTAARYGVASVRTYGGARTFDAFLASDAVVYGGGSVVKELPAPQMRYRVVAALALLATLARATGRRVIYSAVGIEQLGTRLGRALASLATRAADLLHVRDEGSQRLLEAMGVGERARVVADPAFLLAIDEAALRRADEILAPASGRPVVVLNPMWSGEAHVARDEVVRAFVSLADEITGKLDAGVLILPFKTAGADNDAELARDVALLVGRPDRVMLAPSDLRPAEALAVMAQSALVVGMRHHGALLALVAGAPVVAIPYAPKTRHLVEEFGLRAASVPAAELTSATLSAAFWRVWSLRAEQPVATRAPLVAAQVRARENFRVIRSYLRLAEPA